MDAVVSLGGSIVADAVAQGELDAHVDALQELAAGTDTLVVVTGAGPLKRYIDAADATEARKDLVGIRATRLHAATLAASLGANSRIPDTLEDAGELAHVRDVVVLGGLLPGQSTDAVAAECAELIDADRLVIATTVDGVYDADPDADPDAAKRDTVPAAELLRMAAESDAGAGRYALMDTTAASLIHRSTLDTVVVDGRDPAILAAALGDDHGGTQVTHDP